VAKSPSDQEALFRGTVAAPAPPAATRTRRPACVVKLAVLQSGSCASGSGPRSRRSQGLTDEAPGCGSTSAAPTGAQERISATLGLHPLLARTSRNATSEPSSTGWRSPSRRDVLARLRDGQIYERELDFVLGERFRSAPQRVVGSEGDPPPPRRARHVLAKAQTPALPSRRRHRQLLPSRPDGDEIDTRGPVVARADRSLWSVCSTSSGNSSDPASNHPSARCSMRYRAGRTVHNDRRPVVLPRAYDT